MKRIFFVLFLIMMVVSSVSAYQETLGNPIKVGDNVNLHQTCGNCTYNNVTSIRTPNGHLVTINDAMTKDGSFYNYSTGDNYSLAIGTYVVNGVGDPNGVDTVWVYSYEVTPSGFINTLGLYLVFLIVLISIVVLGFSIKEVWFVVIGGLGLMMLGIYSINSGIVGFKDMFMTWGVGLFEIGVGAILAVGSAIQKLYYD